MPKVEAWHCDRTGKLFLHRSDYVAHLRTLRREHAKAMADLRWQAKTDAWIGTMRQCSSFEDISDWLIREFPGPLMKDSRLRINIDKTLPTILKFTWNRMTWSDCCSNSHCAPAGKPQNWYHKADLPLGYPGWRGEIYVSTDVSSWHFTDALKILGIHTGAGGGGWEYQQEGDTQTKSPNRPKPRPSYRYRYEVTLFAEEWESLAVMTRMNDAA